MARSATLLVAVFLFCAGSTFAQDREGPSPFFECPYINYFDDGCPQLEEGQRRVQPQVEGEPEQRELEGEPETDHEWSDDAPERLLPLFPKESLAPDTPALFRMLLISPTLETARRYVRWYERRMSRIRAAQALVDLAGRELLAERAARE